MPEATVVCPLGCGWKRTYSQERAGGAAKYGKKKLAQHQADRCAVKSKDHRANFERAKDLYPSCRGLTDQQWLDGWNTRLDFLVALTFSDRVPAYRGTVIGAIERVERKIMRDYEARGDTPNI